MKRNLILVVCLLMFLGAVPAYGFLDYFFSGGSEGEPAIGNSVVGDLRTWWSGNPVYNFNPYYSGPSMQQPGNVQPPTEQYVSGQQGQQPQAGYAPPTMNYYPPPQAAGSPYGQGSYPAAQQQPYQQPAPMAQQPYQQPYQETYQQSYPQQYQQSYPQQYQQPAAPMQQPMVQQQVQQPVMQPMQQPVQPTYGGAPAAQTYQGAPAPQPGYQAQYPQPTY